jgi:hypothetical protein
MTLLPRPTPPSFPGNPNNNHPKETDDCRSLLPYLPRNGCVKKWWESCVFNKKFGRLNKKLPILAEFLKDWHFAQKNRFVLCNLSIEKMSLDKYNVAV